ncbi:chaperone protein DnaJ 1 [Clonorchis sinensis]|uniref:Chaperone protein DnaJ 1 n=1 Tax=Clonorchis sinensis TaxID=79923 RepID=G7YU77_CLOSI|nr:chaperone protein DnaJ 1 [Clonorchis sinensis]
MQTPLPPTGRQLQSFYTAKPLCSTCSRDIALSDKISVVKEHGRPTDKLSPRRARTYRTHFGGHSEARKRLRSNLAYIESNSSEPQFRRFRGSFFVIALVRDAQSLDEVDDDFHEKPTRRDGVSPAPLQKPSAVVGTVTSKKKLAATPKGQAFRMTEFSPPTQQFDASFAIENAVNHSDLAAVEITRLDSLASTAPYMREDTADEQESITLSMDTQQQSSKFVFRRPPSSRSRSRLVASQLLQRHRGLALRAHQNRRTVRAKHRQVSKRHSLTRNKRKDLDETTADASLPSDFLESEYSLRIPEVKLEVNSGISAPVPQLAEERTTELEQCLPSLGGSPTATDRQLFKRPEAPVAQTTSSSKPTQAGKSQSVLNQVDDLETQLSSQYPESMDAPLPNQVHGIRNEERPSSESLVSKEDKENRVPSVPQVALGSEALGSRCEVKVVGPVERNKEARRQLTGHSCASCKEYYTSLGLSSPQVANRIHRCSKHRSLHGSPPSTPKGFWDISIPDSEYPVKFEDSGKEQIKRSRRRHPLNFPDKSGPSTDPERVHRPDACLRDAGKHSTKYYTSLSAIGLAAQCKIIAEAFVRTCKNFQYSIRIFSALLSQLMDAKRLNNGCTIRRPTEGYDFIIHRILDIWLRTQSCGKPSVPRIRCWLGSFVRIHETCKFCNSCYARLSQSFDINRSDQIVTVLFLVVFNHSRYATQTRVKDYYSVLQVKPTASQAEIKNAYLELSKKYHPDTAEPNSNSKSRFVDLTEAYSVLGKVESRQEYDAYRKLLDLGLVGDGFRMHYPKPSGELDAAALEAYQDEMRRKPELNTVGSMELSVIRIVRTVSVGKTLLVFSTIRVRVTPCHFQSTFQLRECKNRLPTECQAKLTGQQQLDPPVSTIFRKTDDHSSLACKDGQRRRLKRSYRRTKRRRNPSFGDEGWTVCLRRRSCSTINKVFEFAGWKQSSLSPSRQLIFIVKRSISYVENRNICADIFRLKIPVKRKFHLESEFTDAACSSDLREYLLLHELVQRALDWIYYCYFTRNRHSTSLFLRYSSGFP